MTRFTLLIVPVLALAGCNKESSTAPAPATEPAPTATKPTEAQPTPPPEPAPTAPTPEPAAAAAPAAAPAGSLSAADLTALVDGSAIATNAAGDIALFATEEGDDQLHALRIIAGGTRTNAAAFDFDANLDPARFAAAHATELNKPLAGFTLVPGVKFSGGARASASIPGVGEIRYNAKTTTLELDAGGKKTPRKLDGGGVTTPIPRAAFVLPGNKLVVTVRYKGDMVTTEELESFTL